MSHRPLRTLLLTLGAMTALVAGPGACVPVIVPHALRSSDGQIGQTGIGYRCTFEHTRLTNDCNSYLAEEVFWSQPDSARFAQWRAGAKWDITKSVSVERPNGSKIRIIALNDARRTALRKLSEHGALVALMLADPNGPADPVYPIGGRHTSEQQFSDSFFVAIDTFGVHPHVGSDVPFAKARIYGIRQGKAVRMKGRGFINWCRHSMQSQSNLATFASCAVREQLARYEEKYGADSVRRFLGSNPAALVERGVPKTFVDQLTRMNNEPGSLPCAAGCCYVSFDPEAPDYPELATRAFQLPWADAPHHAVFVRERGR